MMFCIKLISERGFHLCLFLAAFSSLVPSPMSSSCIDFPNFQADPIPLTQADHQVCLGSASLWCGLKFQTVSCGHCRADLVWFSSLRYRCTGSLLFSVSGSDCIMCFVSVLCFPLFFRFLFLFF